jgi:hypothetical protein
MVSPKTAAVAWQMRRVMPDGIASGVTVTNAVGPIGRQLPRSIPDAGSVADTGPIANARSSSYSRSIANAGSSSRARPIARARKCGRTVADCSCAWARPCTAAG